MSIVSHIKGLQHLGLPTKYLEKTIAFYESLGFQVAFAADNKGQQVRFLKLGQVVIETYEDAAATECAGAWNHVALDVDDIEAVWQAVKAAGYTPIEAEIQFLPFWENGVRYFNILGPNQETVEFAQML